MFKIEIKRLSDNKITHGAQYPTMDEVNSFITKIEAIRTTNGSNPWGFKERQILDEEGNVLETLPQTYEIIITDISAQVSQAETNFNAKKFLADTDWKCLRHKDQTDLGVPTSMTEQEYQDLLQARQNARDSIIE